MKDIIDLLNIRPFDRRLTHFMKIRERLTHFMKILEILPFLVS